MTVIHNGIIEDYRNCATPSSDVATGWDSETDTEVLGACVEEAYAGDIADAVRAALRQVHGAYAVAVLHRAEPDRLVGARHDVPLVVGLGEGENLLASDVAAVLGPHPRRHLPGRGGRRRPARRPGR